MSNKKIAGKIPVHIVFTILTLLFVVPFLIVLSVSFSNETTITTYGFSFIPKKVDLAAYKMLFSDFGKFGRAIAVTGFVSIVAPIISCVVQALIAYALAQEDFKWKKPINWYLIITMIISAGTIPSYVINTTVYHLNNNPLIYFVSSMVGAWNIILYRTFFKNIPKSLIEACRIDGATEIQTIWYVVVPMTKAVFAIEYTLAAIGRWNNLTTSLLYISDEKWMSLQHVMQRILTNSTILKQAYAMLGSSMKIDVPIMTLRYAMCVISMVPIFIVFPYAQKYFSKGVAVGSVKG